jgi:hypothetical protein
MCGRHLLLSHVGRSFEHSLHRLWTRPRKLPGAKVNTVAWCSMEPIYVIVYNFLIDERSPPRKTSGGAVSSVSKAKPVVAAPSKPRKQSPAVKPKYSEVRYIFCVLWTKALMFNGCGLEKPCKVVDSVADKELIEMVERDILDANPNVCVQSVYVWTLAQRVVPLRCHSSQLLDWKKRST